MTDHRMDPTTLRALAKRVEAGESGREIDARVWNAVTGEPTYTVTVSTSATDYNGKRVAPESGIPHITTSLDAVEALRVRLLPEFPPMIIPVAQGRGYNARQRYSGRLASFVDIDINGTETAARLAALLFALAAKVEGERADA